MSRLFKLKIAGNISRAYGTLLRFAPTRGVRVLMYHAIGSSVPNDELGIYSIAPDTFARHILSLKSQRVLPLSDALLSLGSVALTFDDGFSDVLEFGAPILCESGIPFTVFVTTDFMRSNEKHYLSVGALKRLSTLPGVTIGAHGKTHRRLTELSKNDLANELVDSKAELEDIVGKSVLTMSYPHGATSQQVIDAVANAGYTIAAGSDFGLNTNAINPLSLKRTDIWNSDDSVEFEQKLAGKWDWLAIRSRIRL